jgi:hypothetical protein
MDLVLLVGVGVAAVFVVGVSARRAALGNRMVGSLDALKTMTRQKVMPDAVVMSRVPVRGTVSKAVVHGHDPMVSNGELLADLIPTGVEHVPLHARRAS